MNQSSAAHAKRRTGIQRISTIWCACGRSKTQPFCDGSHKGTGLTPVQFKAEESKTVWLCGCKQTKGRPMCDGTHKSL